MCHHNGCSGLLFSFGFCAVMGAVGSPWWLLGAAALIDWMRLCLDGRWSS
jgi:hypothetical protein